MSWYRFKVWQYAPQGMRIKFMDGCRAETADKALAFFLGRKFCLKGWNYTAERCLTSAETKSAFQLNELRTAELCEIADPEMIVSMSDKEFADWMSLPAYEVSK